MIFKVRKNIKIFLILFGILLIFGSGLMIGESRKNKEVLSNTVEISPSPFASEKPSPTPKNLYQVLKVVDGDTIDVSVNGKSQAVRLIGIDTPEVVDPRKPVQCFGQEASKKAKEILNGKSIYLESDLSQGDLDKYKRLLRYVFLEDGTNFNLMMISQGFAHEYTYNLPYKYQSEFKSAQKQAMQKELGLWSPNTCNGNTGSPATQINQETPVSQTQTGSSSYKVTGTYTCDCSKLCSQISTCDEAYYQLQNCGCSARDSDGDGIPCESICR